MAVDPTPLNPSIRQELENLIQRADMEQVFEENLVDLVGLMRFYHGEDRWLFEVGGSWGLHLPTCCFCGTIWVNGEVTGWWDENTTEFRTACLKHFRDAYDPEAA